VEDEDFYSFEKEVLSELMELGIAEMSGVTEEGEITFRLDMPKLKEHFPDFYNMLMDETTDAMIELYERGLVTVEYDVHLEPTFSISSEGREALTKLGLILPDEGEIDEQ
jgi:hypothetical protein